MSGRRIIARLQQAVGLGPYIERFRTLEAEAAQTAADLRLAMERARQLETALEIAKNEIRLLAETGTERIAALGGLVDPPERTYGPILARIEAAANDVR
jgi:hypothetical protein